MQFDKLSELKVRIITCDGCTLLYRLFLFLNPDEISPSMKEEKRTTRELLLCIIGYCILCLFHKGDVYKSKNEGTDFFLIFFFIFLFIY
jgi:hypothetical protein